jgi:hypothetical protein
LTQYMSSISITLDLFNKQTKLLARAIWQFIYSLTQKLGCTTGENTHDINIRFAVDINIL